jgi:hypothetical protein
MALLFEVGSFVFGELITFSLVIIPALITIGSVGNAILLSMIRFECGLPMT